MSREDKSYYKTEEVYIVYYRKGSLQGFFWRKKDAISNLEKLTCMTWKELKNNGYSIKKATIGYEVSGYEIRRGKDR